jgi:riboflavin synthase alpha subunit
MGDRVNLEVDIIGKYVEKFVAGKESVSGFANLLKEKGFVNE